MAVFYIDGEYKDESEASVSVLDLSVLRGYGVFDFLRTYNKKPFYLDEHIKRLKNSAKLTGIKIPLSDEDLKSVILETLERNDFKESNVRIVVTGGISPDGITPGDDSKLIVMVSDLMPMPKEWYIRGVKIITSKTERYIAEAKSTNYLAAVMVLTEAKKKGAIESVYVDKKGRVLEGTTSNLFLVIEGEIVTPGDGVLKGITREVVIEKYKKHKIKLRDLFYEDLEKADEAFITASNKEIVPVVKVDDLTISESPGKITKDVIDFFKKYTENY